MPAKKSSGSKTTSRAKTTTAKTTSRAKYGQAGTPAKVFAKGKKVAGKDPAMYRKDAYGTIIYKDSHGKNSAMGWQVDHIKPASKSGSNDIVNLQPLNTKINLSKGNTLVKASIHNHK